MEIPIKIHITVFISEAKWPKGFVATFLWHLRNKEKSFVPSVKLLMNVWTLPGCVINHIITFHLYKDVFVKKLCVCSMVMEASASY